MKTLILDCDGVLYSEWNFPLFDFIDSMEKYAYSINISKEEYEKISKETMNRGEQGLYNVIFNLVNKDIDKFNKFCKNVIDTLDYKDMKRDDELYNLLIEASKKYEICIFTNNSIFHLDKVYKQLFGKSLQDFPFPSYDITSTFKNGCFHPKHTKEGYINFLEKINKDKKDCIIIDNKDSNIKKCIEIGIQSEYITKENTINNFLKKLINSN